MNINSFNVNFLGDSITEGTGVVDVATAVMITGWQSCAN